MTSTAIATLTAAFDQTHASPVSALDRDRPAAILSWPSVPIEIVRAAGLRPVFVRGSALPTPMADLHLEPDIFPSRLRHLMDAALTGSFSDAACIILPRTSEPDYKAFLYLREFARLGIAPALPPVLLFDVLQSEGASVQAYDVARVGALLEELASLTGRRHSVDDVRQQIEWTNAARAAARSLTALRDGKPRFKGSDAVPTVGALWQLHPQDYAPLASAAAADVGQRPQLESPRVLLAGAPVDGPALHSAIESHGAIVVAETGPWGCNASVEDVSCVADPLTALADHYRCNVHGSRIPQQGNRASIARHLHAVEAVVVSLPPEDTVFGWDYPAFRTLLQARGIPNTCLRADPCRPLSPEDHNQLDALLGAAARFDEVSRA